MREASQTQKSAAPLRLVETFFDTQKEHSIDVRAISSVLQMISSRIKTLAVKR